MAQIVETTGLARNALIAALAMLIVGGGVFLGARAFMGPTTDEAIHLAPADSTFYFNAFVDPSRDQKRALRDLLERFGEAPEAVKQRIGGLLDEGLAKLGLTYEEDVKPWLGRQIAIFATDVAAGSPETATLRPAGSALPAAAALVSTEDVSATREMIDAVEEASGERPEAREYEGFPYDLYEDGVASGFIESFWVIGSRPGFEAAVKASQGSSLADSDEYKTATSVLTDDYLALFYADISRAFDEALESGGLSDAERESVRAVPNMGQEQRAAGTFSLSGESLILEVASGVPPEGAGATLTESFAGPGLLPELPGDSWFGAGGSNLGGTAETLLDAFGQAGLPGADPALLEEQFRDETGLDLRTDLLSWMGDAGIFVQGTGFLDLGGGVVIESTDPERSHATIDALGDLLVSRGAPLTPVEIDGLEGFAYQDGAMPQPVNVVAGDRVIAVYGSSATSDAISGEQMLSESDDYQRALESMGDGFNASFFLDVDAVSSIADAFVPAGETSYEQEIRPWLEPLSHVVLGSRRDGDALIQRLVIGVR